MSDAAQIDAWQPKFAAWLEFALPLLAKGEAKDAFAKYPWFTTGGYSIEGVQEAVKGVPSFDGRTPEIRDIPLDVDRTRLRIDHVGYDHRFAKEDINANLPLDRLSELVKSGEIGSIPNEVPVLMGLQPNVAPLIRETIPELVGRFKSDGVEAAGIATALVSVMPPLSSAARPPRQLIRKLNIGATVGRPHDVDGQLATLRRMIALIDTAENFGSIDRDS